jgi:hypothetical protein
MRPVRKDVVFQYFDRLSEADEARQPWLRADVIPKPLGLAPRHETPCPKRARREVFESLYPQ